MATSWLRGTVKEVPSGDTLVIAGTAKNGVHPEKRITLSSLIAPKLGKRDGSVRDENFAWESREFLRKLAIGRPCVFKVDYVIEQIGNREFGSVFLDDKENVALAVASNGWAKVRQPIQSSSQPKNDKNQSPYLEDLLKAEENAKARGLGMWSKDPHMVSHAVRAPISEEAYSTAAFYQELGKGKSMTGIVEAVLNGSTLRVCLLPEHRYATAVLSGIQCPSMGRRIVVPEQTEEAVTIGEANGHSGNGVPASNGAPPTAAALVAAGGPGPSGGPEPYAREAKMMVESKALNREVRIMLEGIDKHGNLFASVFVPGPNSEEESLAEALVQAGYAKVVEWSLNMMLTGSMKLRELERAAKLEKRSIWTNYVPAPTGQAKASDSFTGRVMEVVSGDCIVVRDNGTRMERRIQLSSIRAPRTATRDRAADPWANDAKDFLRKRLIGREVDVKLEYTRKILPTSAAEAAIQEGERVLVFGNIEVPGEKGEEPQNVAEMVVARGFATVIRHRSDEERSRVYERLVEVEDIAKAAKRGIHSGKEPAANRINDISQPGSASRAKQHLAFFQRGGNMTGVVDYVLSGHRLRVTIPKEGVTIVFAPSGIKTPSRAQPAGNGKPAVKAEPFAEDAIAFTRELVLQRDVEVNIETMDRGGTFLGSIILPASGPGARPISLGLSLLRAGLARLQENVDIERLPGGSDMKAAEAAAKEARLKIWETWAPEVEQTKDDDEEAESASATNGHDANVEVVQVAVTEVAGPREIYVQMVGEPRLTWITEQLAGLDLSNTAANPELRAGSLCMAQYTLDNAWYRAYIEKVNRTDPEYEVYFLDYGNRERLSSTRIRPIDAPLAAVPPQAHLCELAYVKIPEPPSEYAADSLSFMRSLLLGGSELLARVVTQTKPGAPAGAKDVRHPRYAHGVKILDFLEPETSESLIVEMLKAGVARLPKPRKVPAHLRDALTPLQQYEEEARKDHKGMFQYGDPGDSDDEDLAASASKPKKAWGR